MLAFSVQSRFHVQLSREQYCLVPRSRCVSTANNGKQGARCLIVRLRSDFSSATGPQHHGQRAPIMQSMRAPGNEAGNSHVCFQLVAIPQVLLLQLATPWLPFKVPFFHIYSFFLFPFQATTSQSWTSKQHVGNQFYAMWSPVADGGFDSVSWIRLSFSSCYSWNIFERKIFYKASLLIC